MQTCGWELFYPNLLFDDVHRCLMGFQLLVFEEDLPTQLQWRWQVRVIAEVTLKKETSHKTFPTHSLMEKIFKYDGWHQHDLFMWEDVSCQKNERGKKKDVWSSSKKLKCLYQLKTRQKTTKNKHDQGDVNCQGAQSWLNFKDFNLSRSPGVGLQGRGNDVRFSWMKAWWHCMI